MTQDALSAYSRFDFTAGKWTRPVYRRGHGPAVIVIHEIPGLHPLVMRFAGRLVDAGMSVYLPSLFGTPGKEATKSYALGQMVKNICIGREFAIWGGGRSSPIVDWLRALARKAHEECGGPGVGAIGMCFTGGYALAMMTEPSVVAPVLSQPSMPAPVSAKTRAAVDASPVEIACARERMQKEDLSLLGLRFKSDKMVPAERFATLKREFGDRFEAIELEDKDAAPAPMAPHSVLTIHLDERPDSGSKQAERRTIAFFRQRLGLASESVAH